MLLQRLILSKIHPGKPFQFIRLITTSSVQIDFKDGLANITVPLPSRGESCVFQVRQTMIFQFEINICFSRLVKTF